MPTFRRKDFIALDMLNVLPAFSRNNGPNSTLAHPKLECEFSGAHCRINRADFNNFFGCEPACVYTFSTRGVCSTFFDTIQIVVSLSSKEQMTWTHTRLVITLVKTAKRFRNWATIQQPRNPVGTVRSPRHASPIYNPVTSTTTCCPNPTLSKVGHVLRGWTILINLCPKALADRFRKALRGEIFFRKFNLHSFSLVDCLPRSRPRKRGGISFLPNAFITANTK